MLIIPNVGAEQPLVTSEHIEALRPFVTQVMKRLVKDSREDSPPGDPHLLAKGAESYLPVKLRDALPADAVFAFINTPDTMALFDAIWPEGDFLQSISVRMLVNPLAPLIGAASHYLHNNEVSNGSA